MICRIALILLLPLAAVMFAVAQTSPIEPWTRIQMQKGDVSFAVPPSFLVDAEKRENGQLLHVMSYRDRVTMEVWVYKQNDRQNRIGQVRPVGLVPETDFKTNGVEGREFISPTDSTFTKQIYLASKDRFYILRVSSGSKTDPVLTNFLQSIVVSGARRYQQKSNNDSQEITVIAESLTTSSEISEAFTRRSTKKESNIEFHRWSEFTAPDEPPPGIRPALVVFKPHPKTESMITTGTVPPSGTTMRARLVVNFLADGEIGDIVVYSDSNKYWAKACAEAAEKIKFIPGRQGDKNIDSRVVVEFGATITSVSSEIW